MDKYSQLQFNSRYNEIYHILVKNRSVSEKASAYVMGGQPGAGKSSLASFIERKYLNNNAVNISGDDYRKLHPNFNKLYEIHGDNYIDYTRKFSSQVVEKLIDDCSNKRYSLLIEGTMRSCEVPLETCKLLKSRNYEVSLFVMATQPVISYVGTLTRYEKMLDIGTVARKTTKEQHDDIVSKIASNLEKIYKSNEFDNIVIMNRNQEVIYDMSQTPHINPGYILKQYHIKPLTEKEIEKCKSDLEYVIKSMINRGEDKNVIEDVKKFYTNFLKDNREKNILNKKSYTKEELKDFVNQVKSKKENNKLLDVKKNSINKNKMKDR